MNTVKQQKYTKREVVDLVDTMIGGTLGWSVYATIKTRQTSSREEVKKMIELINHTVGGLHILPLVTFWLIGKDPIDKGYIIHAFYTSFMQPDRLIKAIEKECNKLLKSKRSKFGLQSFKIEEFVKSEQMVADIKNQIKVDDFDHGTKIYDQMHLYLLD
jgi:hypothetical protein